MIATLLVKSSKTILSASTRIQCRTQTSILAAGVAHPQSSSAGQLSTDWGGLRIPCGVAASSFRDARKRNAARDLDDASLQKPPMIHPVSLAAIAALALASE